MALTSRETLTYTVSTQADCLLHLPEHPHSSDVLVLALHGYGMNARSMLDLSLLLVGDHRIVASLQAPNQFYEELGKAGSSIGYNWGTHAHGPANIRLHHEMIRNLRCNLEQRFAFPARRTILLGFSQPVGFNYRFAATYPDEIGGVIGICGGVPRDWDTAVYQPVSAPLLHIARQEDHFYPAEVTALYADKLRRHAPDVTFHMLPGGHRVPSKGRDVIEPWIQRVFH